MSKKMSGVRLEVVPTDVKEIAPKLEQLRQDGKTAVCIGRTAFGQLEKSILAKSKREGAFALRVTKDQVLVAGLEQGTLYGVMELLEQQGVRWFMPGDLGTVIPEKKTVVVDPQETVQAPSFVTRIFQMPDPDWQLRVRCGGPRFPASHGLRGVPPFKKAPEMYALRNGKRVQRQHCLSNPELLDAVVADMRKQLKKGHGPIFGMGPNDGGGFCECGEVPGTRRGRFRSVLQRARRSRTATSGSSTRCSTSSAIIPIQRSPSTSTIRTCVRR